MMCSSYNIGIEELAAHFVLYAVTANKPWQPTFQLLGDLELTLTWNLVTEICEHYKAGLCLEFLKLLFILWYSTTSYVSVWLLLDASFFF